MTKAVRSEQSSFGFVPIFLVSVVVALTTAALVIAWIFSWVYLREHQQGVVEGRLHSQPSVVATASGSSLPVSRQVLIS